MCAKCESESYSFPTYYRTDESPQDDRDEEISLPEEEDTNDPPNNDGIFLKAKLEKIHRRSFLKFMILF